MKLTKKQRANNVASSMIRTLTEIATEDKRILEKGTNNRGAVLGTPEDIKAAFGAEQLTALEEFIARFASDEAEESDAQDDSPESQSAAPATDLPAKEE